MIRLRTFLIALSTLLVPAGVGAGAGDATELAVKARSVFKQFCHRCHHGEGSEGGEFDALKDETLTSPRGDEKPYVVAGKPEESFLFSQISKGRMPPKAIKERPSSEDKKIIEEWIKAGAPKFPSAETRKHISVQAVLTAIRDHLRNAGRDDKPYLRYFTLHHLHNNPRVPDADLRVYRAALAKAVNSLSWKPRIVLPEAIDKDQTVYVIDIRDLDWDRNQRWGEIMRAYPYGLKYHHQPEPNLHKVEDEIQLLADCELAYIRADWFVATATRPPLYHTLLQIPDNAVTLEKELKVNVQDNFLRDRLARAGFAVSGVSGQNRLVERHESAYGAYWKSYDFKAQNDRGNLTLFPLGPAFPRNPHPNQTFEHDGGEIIFNLPNGLQGYMLVDGKDCRIDVGPVQVVNDALKTSGTPEIVAGVSCMSCHKHGMVPLPRDSIREGAAVGGEARRKVVLLYPEQARMEKLVAEDEERFLKAVEKAAGPFLQVDSDKDKPTKEFPEPIGEIARLYRLNDLDLVAAACELGIEKPEQLKGMIQGNRQLRSMGLAVLVQGGAVKRHDWEEVKGTSLFQRAARELECGTPFRVLR